jgi:hypothetical protein
MCDPSCHKEQGSSSFQVRGALAHSSRMHKITNMVESHDHHYKAPGYINAVDSFHKLCCMVRGACCMEGELSGLFAFSR